MTSPDPVQLLQWSRDLLTSDELPVTQRTRAAALLARQAVEQAVTTANAGVHSGMQRITRFDLQLLCLPLAADEEVVADASVA